MIDTKLELAKALDTYIKEKHTQEECTGFIDGFEKYDALFVKRIVMHRRELLIDLLKWVDDGYNMGETAEIIVDDYIKTKGNL